MLDTISNKQSIDIKAINGTIIKNYKDSFFVRFHLQSPMSECLLTPCPTYKKESVVVLQMMMCGDMQVIAELIYKSDFEDGGEI